MLQTVAIQQGKSQWGGGGRGDGLIGLIMEIHIHWQIVIDLTVNIVYREVYHLSEQNFIKLFTN